MILSDTFKISTEMAIITYNDFPKIRKRYRRNKIVFCSGSFDLTHAGHVLFFEDCKKLGEILVVVVGSDKMIKRNKSPERPVLNESIRLKTVASLKPVDFCVMEKTMRKHPLGHLTEAFKKLRPDFYAINKDAFDIPYRKMIAKKFNVKLVILDRWCPPAFEDISTTKIIEKIKNL